MSPTLAGEISLNKPGAIMWTTTNLLVNSLQVSTTIKPTLRLHTGRDSETKVYTNENTCQQHKMKTPKLLQAFSNSNSPAGRCDHHRIRWQIHLRRCSSSMERSSTRYVPMTLYTSLKHSWRLIHSNVCFTYEHWLSFNVIARFDFWCFYDVFIITFYPVPFYYIKCIILLNRLM